MIFPFLAECQYSSYISLHFIYSLVTLSSDDFRHGDLNVNLCVLLILMLVIPVIF
jgi:hypothetical protein